MEKSSFGGFFVSLEPDHVVDDRCKHDQKGERDIVERSYNAAEAEKLLGHRLKNWEIIYNQSKQQFTWAKRVGFINKQYF